MAEDAETGEGGATALPDPVDELFYHDGSWYLYKPRPIELPKFEFMDIDAELERLRFVREIQWLTELPMHFPRPICFITGVS